MKSNYQMLLQLETFKPKHRGFLIGEEVDYLRETFHIEERSNIELQNLRDFAVMYYSLKCDKESQKAWELSDIMSGICGVIDDEKFKRGMEI